MSTISIIQVNTIAELKAQRMAPDTMVLFPGVASKLDGMGGLYTWDAASTAAEDLVNYNVIISNRAAIGRWQRVFQRVVPLVHGTLVMLGSAKTFFAPGVTNASGQCTLNLTMDNTTNGPAIFSEIWYNDSQFDGEAATPTDVVQSRIVVKPKPANGLKLTTHGYHKGNVLALAIGLLYNPYTSVGAGVAVRFQVNGR